MLSKVARNWPLEAAKKLVRVCAEGDIVAKINLLSEIQVKSPYKYVGHRYEKRIAEAIREMSDDDAYGSLNIFSNVFYVSEPLLTSVTTGLVHDVSSFLRTQQARIPADVHLFSCDHTELIELFLREGSSMGWGGRMDNVAQRRFQSVSVLIDALTALGSSQSSDQVVKEVFEKRFWILITDNALGGGSVASEVNKLEKIRLEFADRVEMILVVIQLTSDFAISRCLAEYENRGLLFYGLRFPESSRINSPDCNLFESIEALEAAKSACERFGSRFFDNSLSQSTEKNFFDSILEIHLQRGGDPHFCWGWEDAGFLIVTQRNAPTNSVPLLWYPGITNGRPVAKSFVDEVDYHPPFPRGHSRLTKKTVGDAQRLEELHNSKEVILKCLR